MSWEAAMKHALLRSQETGAKIYVRGFQRTITHVGQWLYGTYEQPDPPIMGPEFVINPRRSVRHREGK